MSKEMSLEEKYENATAAEIMAAMQECEDKKAKASLMVLLRFAIRREESALREAIKQEVEDSKEEKRLMKETQGELFEKRNEYLKAYRNMNSIMTGKSMLKNLDELTDNVKEFNEKSQEFLSAISAHLENLQKIKGSN